MRRKFEIYRTTNNRSTYNKIKKNQECSCPICRWHEGCNNRNEHYGGYEGKPLRYPNWKLISKNKKQWMKKTNLKKDLTIIRFTDGRELVYITFEFKNR